MLYSYNYREDEQCTLISISRGRLVCREGRVAPATPALQKMVCFPYCTTLKRRRRKYNRSVEVYLANQKWFNGQCSCRLSGPVRFPRRRLFSAAPVAAAHTSSSSNTPPEIWIFSSHTDTQREVGGGGQAAVSPLSAESLGSIVPC